MTHTATLPTLMNQWLSGNGVALPGTAELMSASIAACITALLLGLSWFAGRQIGPRIAAYVTARLDNPIDGLDRRATALVRHGCASLTIFALSLSWNWYGLSTLVMGLALSASAATFAFYFLRAINAPRWVAWTIATLAFVSILSHEIGGFDVITATLDRVGLSVGSRRITLLAVVTALVTAAALYAGGRLVTRMISHSIASTRGFDATQKILFQKLAGIVVVVVITLFGVDLLGIDLTSLAVFSGAFGLAVGFGMQKTIGNLIAGVILLMDRSIKPGDVIVVGQSFGWVNKIGVRAVSVITRDGKEHLIPNENLMTQEVVNWSFSDRNVRVRIPVRIGYDTDMALAQKLMEQAAREAPRVLKNPAPNVWMASFGEHAVEYDILVWIDDPENGVNNVKSDVLNHLWLLFKEHGVVVPIPRRELTMANWPDNVRPSAPQGPDA